MPGRPAPGPEPLTEHLADLADAVAGQRRGAASKLRLLRGFVGYATSLAARDKETDLEGAVGELPEVSAYLVRKGLTFEDVVSVEREHRLHA